MRIPIVLIVPQKTKNSFPFEKLLGDECTVIYSLASKLIIKLFAPS